MPETPDSAEDGDVSSVDETVRAATQDSQHIPDAEEQFDDEGHLCQPRSPQEIAARCVVLCCVAAAGVYAPGRFNSWLETENLWGQVSPKEAEWFRSTAPTEEQGIAASWRAESLQMMLWCLGKLPGLPDLDREVDLSDAVAVIPKPGSSVRSFIAGARLRSPDEIDEAYDEVYDAHEAIHEAKEKGQPMPAGVDPGVVYERLYALNWMIGLEGEEWDDVDTEL